MLPVETVKAFLEAVGGLDEEAAVALLEPEGGRFFLANGDVGEGREQVRLLVRSLQSVVDSVDNIDVQTLTSDRFVAVAGTGRGRTITSVALTVRWFSVFEIGPSGKIRAIWAFGSSVLEPTS